MRSCCSSWASVTAISPDRVTRCLCLTLAAAVVLSGCGRTEPAPSPSPAATSAHAATATAATAPVSPPQSARTKNWVELQVGDCLADLPPGDFSQVMVTVVDCATPHIAEVYVREPVAVNTAIADVSNQACADGFSSYTGRALANSPFTMTYLIDSNQDRTSNNPLPSTVICLLQATGGAPLTRSARP